MLFILTINNLSEGLTLSLSILEFTFLLFGIFVILSKNPILSILYLIVKADGQNSSPSCVTVGDCTMLMQRCSPRVTHIDTESRIHVKVSYCSVNAELGAMLK